MQEQWDIFKRRLAGVAAELSKDARPKEDAMENTNLEKNSSSSRSIWRDLRSKAGKVEICALKTVVNPVEIRDEIGRYMQELGALGEDGDRGTRTDMQ